MILLLVLFFNLQPTFTSNRKRIVILILNSKYRRSIVAKSRVKSRRSTRDIVYTSEGRGSIYRETLALADSFCRLHVDEIILSTRANFSYNVVSLNPAYPPRAKERNARRPRRRHSSPYISVHFPSSIRFSLRSTFAAGERARNHGPVICESTNVCSRRRDESRNIRERARDLLLVPSGGPESRNIPEEFDGLLAFLGRGRTTCGRRGKRNGRERAAKEEEK